MRFKESILRALTERLNGGSEVNRKIISLKIIQKRNDNCKETVALMTINNKQA